MSTIEFVHDATPAPQGLRVAVRTGASFELLIGLYARGPAAGELWLHLLGLALAEPDDLVRAVKALDGAELRRHLVGVHVPAWQQLVGRDALEATARGDTRLLDHDRYYAGNARASLGHLLPLTPAQTKRHVLQALTCARDELDPAVLDAVERDAAAKRALAVPAEELIEIATGGYRYEPEPELDEVVLVPHVTARPWLLLCQHDRTRIICYPVAEEHGLEERALALGRALADEGRVTMLRLLATRDASLNELAEAAGVARSTAHHHLAQLRAAGLVGMHGNARAYWFTLRADGLAAARRTLGELAAPP